MLQQLASFSELTTSHQLQRRWSHPYVVPVPALLQRADDFDVSCSTGKHDTVFALVRACIKGVKTRHLTELVQRFIAGLVFNYFIRRRAFAWWKRYNCTSLPILTLPLHLLLIPHPFTHLCNLNPFALRPPIRRPRHRRRIRDHNYLLRTLVQ